MANKFVLKVAGTGGQSKQMDANWIPLAQAAIDLAHRGYGSTITTQENPLSGVTIRSVEKQPVAEGYGHLRVVHDQIIQHINQNKEHA